MLAQLNIAVLIKAAIKLAFFRLVEYLEHLHLWVKFSHGYYLMKLSVEDLRHLFLKLDTLKYLSSFYTVYSQFALFCKGSSTQRCTRTSVSWQFLAWNSLNFSEQEWNDEFQKKLLCFWPFWACNRTHKCWCSRYSTSLKKASFIAALIRTVLSCANIIAKGFSNDQLAF